MSATSGFAHGDGYPERACDVQIAATARAIVAILRGRSTFATRTGSSARWRM